METPRSPTPSARRGASLSTRVVLIAVGLVVAFVSLSRLHLFAVHSNERDAVRLLGSLGPRAVEAADATLPGAAPAALQELVAERVEDSRLSDVSWIEDGRALRRHGYVFGLRRAADGIWCLVAWPWTPGRTGKAVYAFHPELGLRGLPSTAEGWPDGEAEPPAAFDPSGWLEVGEAASAEPRDGRAPR